MTGELDPLTLEPLLPLPGASAGDASAPAANPFFKDTSRRTGTAPLNAPLVLDSAAAAAAPAQRNTLEKYLAKPPSEVPPPDRGRSLAWFGRPVATAVPPKPQAVAPALQRAPSAVASKCFTTHTPTPPLTDTDDSDEEVDQGMCVCV